jgi:hypothetical protein
VTHLADIHGRGSAVMASTVRAYLSAAFAYGMEAEHDYTRKDAGARWGIKTNPVATIKADTAVSQPRNRFLTPTEFLTFWRWLEACDEKSRLSQALRMMLASGQRAEEVLRITDTVYERPRALVYWEKTRTACRTPFRSRHRRSLPSMGSTQTRMAYFCLANSTPRRLRVTGGLRDILRVSARRTRDTSVYPPRHPPHLENARRGRRPLQGHARSAPKPR